MVENRQNRRALGTARTFPVYLLAYMYLLTYSFIDKDDQSGKTG